MKSLQNKFLLILFLALPFFSFSQKELSYTVDRVLQPFTISKAELEAANTLSDINKFYKSSWVKEYYSVEISVTKNGEIINFTTQNDMLTQPQKKLILSSDSETFTKVNVHYLPENNLKNNTPKYFDFSFKMDVDHPAQYEGGKKALNEFIKNEAIEKIAVNDFDNEALAAVKFTIDENGNIENPHIFETSRNETFDKFLISAISKMPSWIPAKYNNGTKVKQEYVLLVGNMQSCVINTINNKSF